MKPLHVRGRRPTLPAVPAPLPDGTWGAWVTGAPALGDRVLVKSNSGKSWHAHVGEVSRRGQTGCLVTLVYPKTYKRGHGSGVSSRPKTGLTQDEREAGARLTLAMGRQHLVSDSALKSARKELRRLKAEGRKTNGT